MTYFDQCSIQLSNRKFLIFSFQFFTFSFVHFCFLSVSEARSFLLYSKYKGRKILAIEFKHLHSKLFQINLVDFSLYIPQKKFEFHSIFLQAKWRLSHLVRLSSILVLFMSSSLRDVNLGRSCDILRPIYFQVFNFSGPWDAHGVKIWVNQDPDHV